MRVSFALILPISILGLACATTGDHESGEPMDAEWIVGSWRVDSYIQAGAEREDVLLQLNFLPGGRVEVIDRNTASRMATQCRWYARVNWVDTSCRGMEIRVLPNAAGPPEVELAGNLRVPYYTEECGRWGVDSNGNPVCLRWDQVERFRNVTARGRGVLEPFRARD